MHGGCGGVPRCLVCREVFPEGGSEARWDDDGAPGFESRHEGGYETVDVEERHDDHGSIVLGDLVGFDDVICGFLSCEAFPKSLLEAYRPRH